jgi:hypothetical protein
MPRGHLLASCHRERSANCHRERSANCHRERSVAIYWQ